MRQGLALVAVVATLLASSAGQGQPIQLLHGHHGPVFAVAFHPDGKQMASAGVDHTVKIWNVATGACIRTLTGHEDKVLALAYAADGRYLASAGRGGTICLWQPQSGTLLARLASQEECIHAAAFGSDGRLFCCGQSGAVEAWDVVAGKRQLLADASGTAAGDLLYALAISPDGRWLAQAGQQGNILLRQLPRGRACHVLEGHVGAVYSLAFTPDCTSLLSGGEDHTVRRWEVMAGRQKAYLNGHQAAVYQVACCRDGRWFASAAVDGEVIVWSSQSQRLCYSHRFPGAALCAAFTPDGRRIAAGTGQAACFLMALPAYLR
jgi:WD40 repeat protein